MKDYKRLVYENGILLRIIRAIAKYNESRDKEIKKRAKDVICLNLISIFGEKKATEIADKLVKVGE